jgi:hypothetical protein
VNGFQAAVAAPGLDAGGLRVALVKDVDLDVGAERLLFGATPEEAVIKGSKRVPRYAIIENFVQKTINTSEEISG